MTDIVPDLVGTIPSEVALTHVIHVQDKLPMDTLIVSHRACIAYGEVAVFDRVLDWFPAAGSASSEFFCLRPLMYTGTR